MSFDLPTVKAIPTFQDNYIWVLSTPQKKQAIVVDPGTAQPVVDFLQQNALRLAGILVTHHHHDHTHGVKELSQKYSVPVYGPNHPAIQGITHPVKDKDVLYIPSLEQPLTVLATPGHTLDHLAYLGGNMLFCGDTLFSGGCGRLFEGTVEQMVESLAKFTALPDQTEVYCAHEYTLQNLLFAHTVEPSNLKIQEKIRQVHALRAKNLPSLPSQIGEEKAINPFLRCHVPEVIHQVEKQAGFTLPGPLEVFGYLRLWKNSF